MSNLTFHEITPKESCGAQAFDGRTSSQPIGIVWSGHASRRVDPCLHVTMGDTETLICVSKCDGPCQPLVGLCRTKPGQLQPIISIDQLWPTKDLTLICQAGLPQNHHA